MKCIACREEIPDRAKICSKCQSYQRAWKNHLKFFGALAGLVVLLLSASTYITTEVSQWLKEETWTDKIEVLDFSITNESSLLNSGDGDIFISYVHLSAKDIGWETLVPINIALKSRQIAVFGPTSDISERLSRHNYRLVYRKTTDQFKMYLHSSALWKDCILLDVHLSDGPSLKLLKHSIGDTINTFAVIATLYFHSSKRQEWKETTFPVVGLIHESMEKNCTSKLNN